MEGVEDLTSPTVRKALLPSREAANAYSSLHPVPTKSMKQTSLAGLSHVEQAPTSLQAGSGCDVVSDGVFSRFFI